MTKQEARLPEKIEKAIDKLAKVADDGILFRSVHGLNYDGGNLIKPLRSAILAALDEARDEVLEEAAVAATARYFSDTRIDAITDAIRALKSKGGT